MFMDYPPQGKIHRISMGKVLSMVIEFENRK